MHAQGGSELGAGPTGSSRHRHKQEALPADSSAGAIRLSTRVPTIQAINILEDNVHGGRLLCMRASLNLSL